MNKGFLLAHAANEAPTERMYWYSIRKTVMRAHYFTRSQASGCVAHVCVRGGAATRVRARLFARRHRTFPKGVASVSRAVGFTQLCMARLYIRYKNNRVSYGQENAETPKHHV